MITQYGVIKDDYLNAYLTKLIGRLFKIIPMNEEEIATLESYVDSLIREMLGNSKVFYGEELLSVCGTLNGINYSDHKSLKSDVFKVIGTITKIRERVM